MQKAAEERKLSLSLRDLISYFNEMEDAIITKLEHEGVDLTGIIEPELVEPQAQQAESSEEDEEAKKRIGIERIRRHMGNLGAFKTGDLEVDERLEERLDSLFGVGRSMMAGFCRKFGLDHFPTIGEFLSHTPEEIVPAPNIDSKRFEKILEELYKKDIVPDEKWDLEGAENPEDVEAQKNGFGTVKDSP